MRYVNYFFYVLKHKYYVWQAGRWLGLPMWILLVHDLSKFLPSEFWPYARYFPERREAHKEEFKRAMHLHYRRNPHHWNHWLQLGKPKPMPEMYVLEMIADWMGAGKAITGNWDITPWLETAGPNLKLHRTTIFAVKRILHEKGWQMDHQNIDNIWAYRPNLLVYLALGD